MPWLVLILAGLLEIAWATGMKYTEDWTRPIPSILVVVSYTLCLFLLSYSVKFLPIGTSYAVWVGMGVVGVTLTGILFFGESASLLKLLCIGMICLGVIGLKIVGEH
jgi:quaternary ammonium compound-resistance protein SugE